MLCSTPNAYAAVSTPAYTLFHRVNWSSRGKGVDVVLTTPLDYCSPVSLLENHGPWALFCAGALLPLSHPLLAVFECDERVDVLCAHSSSSLKSSSR
jgi:hypothetical protein